jgi:hypothetical protein
MTNALENLSVRRIDVFTDSGNGILEGPTESHSLAFLLHRQLSRVIVSIEQSAIGRSALQNDTFRLSGSLLDERLINIDRLRWISAQEGGLVELIPWDCAVEIGQRGTGHPISSFFILTGIYEGQFDFTLGEWHIELYSDKKSELNKKVSRGLGVPLEGSSLRISANKKPQDEHEKLATDIILLLSLACGTGVTFHRWSLDYSGCEQIEFWRSRPGEEMGPGSIIEPWGLGDYIKQALPIWNSISPDEKRALRIAITHLNNSGSGYLDNRLFQVAQTWEYLAKLWVPETDLPEAQKELKNILRQARRAWAKSNPNADPHGLLGDRIAKAFDWPVLRQQIEELAAEFGVNLQALGLDIEHLKAARDSVAHSISLEGVAASSGPHHELLMRAQYGLQIILLRRLHYNGLVTFREDGWLTSKHISHLFAP